MHYACHLQLRPLLYIKITITSPRGKRSILGEIVQQIHCQKTINAAVSFNPRSLAKTTNRQSNSDEVSQEDDVEAIHNRGKSSTTAVKSETFFQINFWHTKRKIDGQRGEVSLWESRIELQILDTVASTMQRVSERFNSKLGKGNFYLKEFLCGSDLTLSLSLAESFGSHIITAK